MFQLTTQKLVDQIVRVEKMFFLSSFLLILSFFFQTRKKKANLFISNCMYLKFQFLTKQT